MELVRNGQFGLELKIEPTEFFDRSNIRYASQGTHYHTYTLKNCLDKRG